MISANIEDTDNGVDQEIADCLNLVNPKSFFLFAGAGSGKTYSLVKALKHIQNTSSAALRLKGQRVGVITYTNAAVDEIKSRIEFDPGIDVSTIHSFAWSLIDGLNHDIREWLRKNLAEDIAKIEAEQTNGQKRVTNKSKERLSKIATKGKRLASLDSITQFTYNPAGENGSRDALNHAEVIKITAHFLQNKPLMQSILIGRYPFLMVDESQDTNKHLVDALFAVQAAHKDTFALGLIGDMMQRIYFDGKEGLGKDLPPDWATPIKKLNRRCPERVVTLINKIRLATDGQQQIPLPKRGKGHIAIFILPNDIDDKPAAERAIASKMAEITDDAGWNQPADYKCLLLEHHMAARRLGFLEMFFALNQIDSFQTGLRDGTLPFVNLFAEQIMPLVNAQRLGDRFTVARIAKEYSPLLSVAALATAEKQPEQLLLATGAIQSLMGLWHADADPKLIDVLRNVAVSGLLDIHDSLRFHVGTDVGTENTSAPAEGEDDSRSSEKARAIAEFLSVPFSQIKHYSAYISGKTQFDTHQGVKGLEFERVMVIMDDHEARGFSFKYESLFGAGGGSLELTRRLFYVTCSRAERSLALVAYTKDPASVKQYVLKEGWFDENEVPDTSDFV